MRTATKNPILQDNKLIAQFMGLEFMNREIFLNRLPKDFINYSDSYKCFHNSWDWLMPVVEKINNLKDETGEALYDVIIYPDYVEILKRASDVILSNFKGSSQIEKTYAAVIEFINWYNENK